MNGAVQVVAGHEMRQRWRSLVILGLAAGVLGGVLISGAGLVRRTASAPDRLVTAVAPGDVRVDVYGSALVDEIVALPEMEHSATATIAVGKLRGPGFVYLGVFVPDEDPSALLHPVVVTGRGVDPDADDEVVVIEDMAETLDLQPGDHMDIDLLTAEEVGQFDTGFGDPDGPSLDVTVVGVIRTPPDVLSGTPIVASPSLGGRLGNAAAGEVVFVDLVDVDGARIAFEDAVGDIGAAATPIPGREELPPLVVTDLEGGTREARASIRVVVAGMVVALVVGASAAAAVLWQSFVRHHGLSASDQKVESALGLTGHERAAARVIPACTTALVAVVMSVPLGVWSGMVAPPGAATRLEPEPGWRVDSAAVALGATLLATAILVIAYWTARRAGHANRAAISRGTATRWSPRRGGWPLLGTSFALSSGSRDGIVPTRAALIGAALGVAGIVATMTVGASLDRLADTPARWGWLADVVVVDVTDEVVADLVEDPRVAALTDVGSAAVAIDGGSTQAYSLDPIEGSLGWTVLDGRHPTDDNEILLGTRIAHRLGVDVGDEIQADTTAPVDSRTLRVVGIGVGPNLAGERLGESVVVTPAQLVDLSAVQLFRELLIGAEPATADALIDDLADRYEIGVPEQPRSVRDLADLDKLPMLLGAFLAILGGAALLHAVVVATHRRRRDLAVLRALGGTRRQLRLTVVTMAAVTGCAGVAIGIPLGIAAARLVWGEMARGAGVAPDVALPPEILPLVIVVPLLAVTLAVWPAARAARHDSAAALRQE